ncbi:MAG: ABC transporter ATP-binding protein [Deltaproteobacteria bacterium]|nr:ABC transporter ATP-binding protein [Deltaproteobacteria bacterium]
MKVTAPHFGSARPWHRAQVVSCSKIARTKKFTIFAKTSRLHARRPRSSNGGLSTYCRSATSGSTSSTRWAAVSCIRRAPQLGQIARPLHEKARACSRWHRSQKRRTKARVDAMIESVGLGAHADLRPAQLSGGQNQRVALARALVLRPRMLLMDEPFGALDAQTREEMQRLLSDLYRSQPCLIVFVTHDVTEALVLGDRVIVLSGQPARIADDFEISEPRPRSSAWQRSSETQALEERILATLHGAGGSRGQVRVTV